MSTGIKAFWFYHLPTYHAVTRQGAGMICTQANTSANNKSGFYAAGLYWPVYLNRLRSRGTKLHDSALDVRKCTTNLDRKILG